MATGRLVAVRVKLASVTRNVGEEEGVSVASENAKERVFRIKKNALGVVTAYLLSERGVDASEIAAKVRNQI